MTVSEFLRAFKKPQEITYHQLVFDVIIAEELTDEERTEYKRTGRM